MVCGFLCVVLLGGFGLVIWLVFVVCCLGVGGGDVLFKVLCFIVLFCFCGSIVVLLLFWVGLGFRFLWLVLWFSLVVSFCC